MLIKSIKYTLIFMLEISYFMLICNMKEKEEIWKIQELILLSFDFRMIPIDIQ